MVDSDSDRCGELPSGQHLLKIIIPPGKIPAGKLQSPPVKSELLKRLPTKKLPTPKVKKGKKPRRTSQPAHPAKLSPQQRAAQSTGKKPAKSVTGSGQGKYRL